jgi:hypothetical protein
VSDQSSLDRATDAQIHRSTLGQASNPSGWFKAILEQDGVNEIDALWSFTRCEV